MMTILEKVCNNYSGDILTSIIYELIQRKDGSFAVLWFGKNSGGWVRVLGGSHRIETEEEARQIWEGAKMEMKRRWTMCVPWPETMQGRKESER